MSPPPAPRPATRRITFVVFDVHSHLPRKVIQGWF